MRIPDVFKIFNYNYKNKSIFCVIVDEDELNTLYIIAVTWSLNRNKSLVSQNEIFSLISGDNNNLYRSFLILKYAKHAGSQGFCFYAKNLISKIKAYWQTKKIIFHSSTDIDFLTKYDTLFLNSISGGYSWYRWHLTGRLFHFH